ncbi:MAG: glycosyltransferase family 1 protein [Candidatus Alkanophagales archaeon]|nr:MAG: glycosyltransferase family 1 protein [Candidatus Alkanophagales archaeon]
MEVVYFVDEFPPFFRGGLGTYAMEMTRKLMELGHSVTVFSRNVDRASTRGLWDGIEVHRPVLVDLAKILPFIVPADVRNWPPEGRQFFAETLCYNILSASKLVNVLVEQEKRDFDVIVSHDWLSAPAGMIASEILKRPFIFHIHSTEQGRAGDGSTTIKVIEKLAGEFATIIVTVSYAVRDELVKLGYDESKIRVVYNGIDPTKYDPARVEKDKVSGLRAHLGIGDNELMILFVGRLTWVKGADSLLRAMPTILREVPNAKLVILGVGEQEGLLKHLISSLQLADSVVLENRYVSEAERILFYAACDVAVFPSRYEPFGIVCTEAMAMAKPVVVGARGTSGLREQVVPSGDDVCGAHINPDDPNDIAKFAALILKDEGLRRKMGQNARKRVLSQFTWDKAARDTINIYEEAAK